MDPCIDDLETHASPGTEPVLDLFVAYMWQELTFVKKQGLCKEVSSEDLKKYALASGIVYMDNLLKFLTHCPFFYNTNAEKTLAKLVKQFIKDTVHLNWGDETY